MKNCLSERDGFLRIDLCGAYEDVHVTIGPFSLRLSLSAFHGLAGAVQEAQKRLSPGASAPKG